MKDIRLIVKIKNNRLVKAREKLGLNQNEMAALCKLRPNQYGRIENLIEYPITKNGWSTAAQNIASAIGICEEELFPEAFKKIQTNKAEVEIGLESLPLAERLQLNGPDEIYENNEFKNRVQKVLNTLTPREEHVLKRRLGFDGPVETLEEIAADKHVLRERVRQIEARALRKLRHPLRAHILKSIENPKAEEFLKNGSR